MTNRHSVPEPLADPVNVAARRMGVSRATAYNQIRAGSLTAHKVGRRTLILRTEQARWLAALPVMSASSVEA
jgi:excisionase family DNA binding protein